MLGENFDEIGEVLAAKEDFAFAVLDVVLQVVGNGFCGAEVFHGVGDNFAEFFGKTEEVVNGVFAVENDGGVFVEVNSGFAEFGNGKTNDFKEFVKSDVDTVFCD